MKSSRIIFGLTVLIVCFMSARVVGAQTSVYQNVRDYGAVGDGVTDDGPAFQRAANVVMVNGGAIIVPAGKYAILTGVTFSSSLVGGSAATKPSIAIRGVGTASQILPKTGGKSRIFVFQNLNHVLLENLTFVGTPNVATDSLVTVSIESCIRATIRYCEFFGVSSMGTNGSIVAVDNSDLQLENSAFRGSSGNYVVGTSVINMTRWKGLYVANTDFIDWGYLEGTYHAKTNMAKPLAWIRLNETWPLTDTMAQKEVRLVGVRMDELTVHGLLVAPATTPAAHIYITGLRVNGSFLPNGYGVKIQNAQNVTIERSWFGWAQNQNTAISLTNAGNVKLDSVKCEAGMNRIEADAATTSLTISNSNYTTLASQAQITNVIANGNYGVTVNPGAGLAGGGSVSPGGTISLVNTGVTSIGGMPGHVNVSNSTGGVTLSLPQSVDPTAAPTFNGLTTTGALNTQGGLNVGQGTTITKIISGTDTLDFDLTTNTSQDLTLSVPGAIVGDVVNLGAPASSVTSNTTFFAWVSANDVLTVRATRASSVPVDPAPGLFRATVIRN